MTEKDVGGRPSYTEEQITAFQERYIELLTEGNTELQISADKAMCCYNTRSGWLDDDGFLKRVQRARNRGSHLKEARAHQTLDDILLAAQEKDNTITSQVASLISTKMKHVQWLTSRQSSDFRDRSFIDHSGNISRKFTEKDDEILDDFKDSE